MRPSASHLIVIAVAFVAGCDVAVEHFPPNRVHALVVSTSRSTPTDVAAEDTTLLVESLFGTPVEPRWPVELLGDGSTRQLVAADNLARAAGPIFSDQNDRHFGLFNEHCVRCHGVSGGGDGPASLLQNPYPRDFRAGIYKWKSTSRGAKPTKSDLAKVIRHGVPGTGMPAFAQMHEEDLQAVIDYVIYLSVRGEFERRLLFGSVDELGYDATRPAGSVDLSAFTGEGEEARELVLAILDDVSFSWTNADRKVVSVPDRPSEDADAIARGKALFHGQIANCAACHGADGHADSVTTLDYDDWTKEFTTRLGIAPADREAVRPFREVGAPRPRPIHPRDLSEGVFRGGGDPETIYRRLVTGIAGSPMPGLIVVDDGSKVGLTTEQVWDLVQYVRSLGGDR